MYIYIKYNHSQFFANIYTKIVKNLVEYEKKSIFFPEKFALMLLECIFYLKTVVVTVVKQLKKGGDVWSTTSTHFVTM